MMSQIPTAIVIAIAALCAAESDPEVTVQQGLLRGKYWTSRGGRIFSAFLGIPFAKPPVNELRFKPPVPEDPWEGVFNATEIHPICPQRDIYRRATLIEGQEDCLYLNVYTPKMTFDQTSNLVDASKNPLPVMIFFHGGGWLCGGGNSLWYGPDLLLDRDVVLVVTNYRLGALGFLSTGDVVVPGNNGLKDQNLAMRWVKDNIAQFGGDPDKVTLFGESAGGASVQLHMTSPLSKDLFHAAISQSGTAHCSWAVSPNDQTARNSRKLAKAFNCPTNTSQHMVDCLSKIDANKIIEQDTIFMKWDTDPMIPFKPVVEPDVEGAFLIEHPIDSLKAGKTARVPWIVGINSQDGALRAAGLFANPHLLDELDQDFNRIAPISLTYDETTNNAAYMTHKIRQFYFGDDKINSTSVSNVVDMYTDGWFLNGADEAARFYKQYTKQPVYYYLFEHRGVASFTAIFGDPDKDYGVCHADELQYLFPVGDGLFPDKKPTEADNRIAEIMTTMWANFAKTGDPTPELDDLITNKWYPVQSDGMEYYSIDSEGPQMKKGLFLERAKFWRRLPTHARRNEIRDEL